VVSLPFSIPCVIWIIFFFFLYYMAQHVAKVGVDKDVFIKLRRQMIKAA